jgi:hypothetical protein
MGCQGWNLLKIMATSDGVHHGVIFILLFPLLPPDGAHRGDELPWMESSEELGYLGLDPLCSHLHDAISIGLPPGRVYRSDGPRWMESRLKPRTVAMDEMGVYTIYIVIVRFIIIGSHFLI